MAERDRENNPSKQDMDEERPDIPNSVKVLLFCIIGLILMNHTSMLPNRASQADTVMKKMDAMEKRFAEAQANGVKRSDGLERRLAELESRIESRLEMLPQTLAAEIKTLSKGFDGEDPPKVFDPFLRSLRRHDAEVSASASGGDSLGLRLECSGLGDTLYHNIPPEDQGVSIKVELQDMHTGSIVEDHAPLTIHIDALNDNEGCMDSTAEQYDIAKPRNRKMPLLSGQCNVEMRKGIAKFMGIKFTDISNRARYRFGSQVVGNPIFARNIKRAASNKAFGVKHERVWKELIKKARALAANKPNAILNAINSDTTTSQNEVNQQQYVNTTGIVQAGAAMTALLHRSSDQPLPEYHGGTSMSTLHGSSEQPLQEYEVNRNLPFGSPSNLGASTSVPPSLPEALPQEPAVNHDHCHREELSCVIGHGVLSSQPGESHTNQGASRSAPPSFQNSQFGESHANQGSGTSVLPFPEWLSQDDSVHVRSQTNPGAKDQTLSLPY